MAFAAALSTDGQTARAVDDVCTKALEELGGQPQLALVFFSPHHLTAAETIATVAQQRLAPRVLLGCSGESIIANERELEEQPALSLWLRRWSQPVELEAFHLVARRTPDGPSLLGWPDGLVAADPNQSAVLLLSDPATFPVELLFRDVNDDHRGLRVMGGMAS